MNACPSCDRPEHDGLLCKRCTGYLRRDLNALPGWLRMLDDVLARQAARGRGVGGKSMDVPLPYDALASKVGAYVRNQLQTWVRELDLGDTANLADNPRAWAHWLAARVERMRMHPAVNELADEIDYCVKLIRRAVDQHDDRVSVGPCEVCGEPLRAMPNVDTVVCRKCQQAGIETVVEVGPRRRALLESAEDRLMSRDDVLRAVPSAWGIEVNRATFRSWLHRGKLAPVEHTTAGTPLYRVGDVLDLAQSVEVPA